MLEFLKCVGVGAIVLLIFLGVIAAFIAFADVLIVHVPWLFYLLVGLGVSWVLGYTYRFHSAIGLGTDNRTW